MHQCGRRCLSYKVIVIQTTQIWQMYPGYTSQVSLSILMRNYINNTDDREGLKVHLRLLDIYIYSQNRHATHSRIPIIQVDHLLIQLY
jgi:hypothetical protein